MNNQKQPALCNQNGCGKPAAFLFTWPGDDQKGICAACSPKPQAVANAIGLHVQLIPISEVQP